MLLVTGATGHVGGAALRTLATRLGADAVVGLARSAQRAGRTASGGAVFRIADYRDGAALARAFEGVTGLLFVASDGAGRDVVEHHANVIAAAAATGVEHIVFTSIVDIAATSPFYFAAVYRDAERRLVESGIPWTILRCGLYADFLLSNWLAPARISGVIDVPAGAARVAPVTRDDVGAAAAAALASGRHRGRIVELTGPRAYSFEELADVAATRFGVPIVYRPCAPTDYLLHCWASMPDPWPHAYSTMFASIAQGRYASTSSGVLDLTGRQADSLEALLTTAPP